MWKIRVIILSLVLGMAALFYIQTESMQVERLQENVAEQVIRFHVLANSDTKEDQKLKLQVRDGILEGLQKKLVLADTKEEAEKILKKSAEEITCTAQKILRQNGNANPVSVRLTTADFPVKTYGDTTFPAGTYETLQVEIGKAEGHNWWCVMYPTLCMVDESVAVVPDDSKKKLQENLGKEYEEIAQNNLKVQYRFKLAEWWNGMWNE